MPEAIPPMLPCPMCRAEHQRGTAVCIVCGEDLRLIDSGNPGPLWCELLITMLIGAHVLLVLLIFLLLLSLVH